MSTFHAVVWMDHSEAHVVMFDREHMEAQRVKSRSHHKHQGKNDDTSAFFADTAKALQGTHEVLLCGPAWLATSSATGAASTTQRSPPLWWIPWRPTTLPMRSWWRWLVSTSEVRQHGGGSVLELMHMHSQRRISVGCALRSAGQMRLTAGDQSPQTVQRRKLSAGASGIEPNANTELGICRRDINGRFTGTTPAPCAVQQPTARAPQPHPGLAPAS